MTEKGVHYLARAKITERLARVEEEIKTVSVQLHEAINMGDLRENSEYDAAKEAMGKLTRERDMLAPVLSMAVVRSGDNIKIFEEGCVLDLKVYGTTLAPLEPRSEEFSQAIKGDPVFQGIVMLGGTLPIQELLVDSALDVDTPVGSYLLGKPSGRYSIKVPGGFAVVVATRLKSSEFVPERIGCEYHG